MHPTVKALLTEKAASIATLCELYGVDRLLLIGSALGEQWDESNSDLDFVAEFGPLPAGIDPFTQFFKFQVDLERMLGLRVDLIERKAIRTPLFSARVDEMAREVYAA